MTRCWVLVLLAASTAAGQIVVKDHATGAIITSPLLLSDVAVNDFEDKALDIVNAGTQSATVNSATATGPYFSLCCRSAFVIPAGGLQTVTLHFAPTQTGYFSGALEIDALAIFVFARSDPAASLFVQTSSGLVQAHSGTPLIVTLGSSTGEQLPCVLENDSAGPVMVNSLSASAGWSLSGAPVLPLTLQAGQQAGFTLVGTLTASAVAAQTAVAGVVTIDQWTYAIDAHPPQPNVLLQLSGTQLHSGQQATLAVNFDSVPAIAETGTVTLTLDTSGPIPLTDPGILFPSTGTTSATFTSVAGQTGASFAGASNGGQSNITFQTGTTAGTLHVHAVWGYSDQQVDVALQPSPIVYGTIEAKRETNALDVTVAGYDNTRTAGRLSFSFFDSQGAFIGQPVTADFTQLFYQYFYQSEFNAGGMFQMVAHFPVTGGTGQIHAVQVDLINVSGDAQSGVIQFQ